MFSSRRSYSYLDAMSDEQLRQYVDELKASSDRRPAVIERLFKAIGVMKNREEQTGPWRRRSDPGPATSTAAMQPTSSREIHRPRFVTVLARVQRTADPDSVEDLACRLARDFGDARSIKTFRTIGNGIRTGRVDPQELSGGLQCRQETGRRQAGGVVYVVRDRAIAWARAAV